MDELVIMKKLVDQGKLRVIPIFYKVEAGDVRKQTGDSEFGKNFWRLAEASNGDQIKEWKEALESISDKMGLSLGEKRYFTLKTSSFFLKFYMYFHSHSRSSSSWFLLGLVKPADKYSFFFLNFFENMKDV